MIVRRWLGTGNVRMRRHSESSRALFAILVLGRFDGHRHFSNAEAARVMDIMATIANFNMRRDSRKRRY